MAKNTKNAPAKNAQPEPDRSAFPLTTVNFKLMLIGLAVIILGFILMAGGKSPDPANFFNYDMFSFRRITLAPILVLAGFGFEIYAIMYRPKGEKKDKE